MVIPTRKVGKYELGRTIGEGSFAKVKYAQNSETGESVAVKVLDRETIVKHKMVEQVNHGSITHEVCLEVQLLQEHKSICFTVH
jgi:serine/threonine protein kinase